MGRKPQRPVLARKKPEARSQKPQGAAIELPASVPAAGKRRTKAETQAALASDYQTVFRSPQGERVLADLMVTGNVYHEIEGADMFAIGVREGERRVALRIARMMGLRPEHFATEAWLATDIVNDMMGLAA